MRPNALAEVAFALQQRVRATPVIMFFDLEGNPVARHTGPTKDKDDFMLLVIGGSQGAVRINELGGRFLSGQEANVGPPTYYLDVLFRVLPRRNF